MQEDIRELSRKLYNCEKKLKQSEEYAIELESEVSFLKSKSYAASNRNNPSELYDTNKKSITRTIITDKNIPADS